MSCIVTESSGNLSFFIDGNLQFDASDEAIYHESLVLPALCILRKARLQSAATTESPGREARPGFKVLICGGGDGLALRECLRFPGVDHVDLVDISEEAVELGRTRFAEINGHSFGDPRLRLTIGDAWQWASPTPYDLIICDFTFPTSVEDSRLLSREWFEKVRSMLAPSGVAVINAVSPEKTPEGFWCVANSLKAAKLVPLPYRVCIPSFRAMGYGVWGFMLASREPLAISQLKGLECPIPCTQSDISRLWRGARFSRAERLRAKSVPINTVAQPRLMQLLLNPSKPVENSHPTELPSLEALMGAIPIGHPYHTRQMIKALAEQVAGTVKSIDLRRLVDEVWSRANRLSERLKFEIGKLREFLRTNFSFSGGWHDWSSKLVATLIIVLTLANSLAPDNAFAKGRAGIGHSSFSRGSFGRSGEFAHMGDVQPGAVAGSGFRSARLGSGGPVDIYGYRYSQRSYRYYDFNYWPSSYYYGNGGYYGGGGSGGSGNGNGQAPSDHQPVFVADDDMVVMDNGDVLVTLSDDAFLVARKGTLTLVSQKSGPLLPVFADAGLFDRMKLTLQGQKATAQLETKARSDWLAWTGWADSMFSSVKDDKLEVRNLEDLQKRLDSAMSGIGSPTGSTATIAVPAGATELFHGCYLAPGNSILFYGPNGKATTLIGETLTDPSGKARALPQPLKDTVVSILKKLAKESKADIASYDSDLRQLNSDAQSSQSDLQQYESIYTQQYDPYYTVDYGTDEIPVSDAINRTKADIGSISSDQQQTNQAKDKAMGELTRFQDMLSALGYGNDQ